MDLISRKAAIKFAKEQIVKETGAYSKGRNAALLVMKSALNNPDAIPTVPAVPLDKLCVWLARFGCPCEINEGMCDDAHGVDRCIGIFNSSAFCWQYWLTKMMEEQDAAFD